MQHTNLCTSCIYAALIQYTLCDKGLITCRSLIWIVTSLTTVGVSCAQGYIRVRVVLIWILQTDRQTPSLPYCPKLICISWELS